jgi:hypothetical protein
MIAVAVVGVVIPIGREAVRLQRLSRYYRQKATESTRLETSFRNFAARRARSSMKERLHAESLRKGSLPDDYFPGSKDGMPTLDEPSAFTRKEIMDLYRGFADVEEQAARREGEAEANHTRRADYYARSARKYERAARYPWLPVPPDPPAPE